MCSFTWTTMGFFLFFWGFFYTNIWTFPTFTTSGYPPRRGKFRRTHAVVASVDLHVVHRADAGVVSDGVVALTRAADAWLLTLIDVCPQ